MNKNFIRNMNKFKLVMVLFAAVLAFAFTAPREGDGGKRPSKTSLVAGDSYRMFVNNLNIPMNREGVIADVLIGGSSGGQLNGIGFLFSSGFFMSGITNGTMWSNAVASASRIQDYQPGTYESGRNDSRAQIYVVRNADGDFAQSWEEWKDAVALGAEFYDGDGDGTYNPVDLNSNGKWDPEEDRPDLLGDEVAWCVFSDQVDPALRRFSDVDPQGIEIRQSVFAFASKGVTGNMIFVRYNILNTGAVADVIDSVYFGVWADPDLGTDYEDDLVGSDTTLNVGYVYNDGGDDAAGFGATPPAFLIDFFQGPISYIAGETYEDVNGNGEYDDGVDTPLDTAFNVRGQVRGVEIFPGAKNLGLSSFVHYMQSHQLLGDPDTRFEARNYLTGTDKFGNPLDPCTWTFGSVLGGVNCAQVNPRYFYSGDPVTQTGWLNNFPTDQRQMSNTGPFQLVAGEPVTITAAYVVGRGSGPLNSITVARANDEVAQLLFDANFPSPPPPPPIDYSVRTGENFIDLSWQTAANIQYEAVDTVLDITRRVQGFFVTAYRTNSKAGEVGGVDNQEIIARYDLADSINNIYVIAPNGGQDLRVPEAPADHKLDSVVYANPETGRINLRITADPFTGEPLIKGREYYFGITQYTLNHNVIVNRATNTYGPGGDYYDALGVAVEEFETPVIVVTMGEDIYNPAIKTQTGQRTAGASDGAVKYVVVNNTDLTGDEYRVDFFVDSARTSSIYTPYWRLTNNTTGQVLIDSSKVYNFDTTSYAGRVTEGFLVKVQNITPEIGFSDVEYQGNEWFSPFSSAAAKPTTGLGVFYVGTDLPSDQASSHPIRAARSTAISADQLRTVEIRFGETGKAYRYIHGMVGTGPVAPRSNFPYAGGITAADTVGKGTIGQFGVGYIDVPFTAWAVDERYGEERQLAVGILENRTSLGGTPDGIWDPKTNLLSSEELIVVFSSDYDPNGGQIQYTGGDFNGTFVNADLMRGFTIPQDAQVTARQRAIASSPLFDAMYVVGMQREDENSFYAAGEKLVIPVETYPYTNRDQFVFKTTPGGQLTADQQKDLFNSVNVFPNPLFGYNPATSFSSTGLPDEPFVTFSNLPEEVTVKVYTLSGTLVRTLTSADKSSPASPFLRWNLQNEDDLRVASGMYLAIVSSPQFGEKILKFALILPQKQIQRF